MKTFVQKWLNSSANKYLVFVLRIGLAAIFILAGLSKTTAPIAEFIGMAKQWNILPDPWVTIYAVTLPWVELIAGLLLLVGLWPRFNASLIALMLLSFLIAISINLARGVSIENCGCFGSWLNLGESFGELLWRDAILFLASIWLIFAPKPLWLSAERWLTAKA
jgi:uncharacterized membrane protein YphA (DoxX/SURF4 family)